MTDKAISYPDEVMELARDVAREAGQRYILAGPMGFIDPVARAIMLDRSRRDPGLTAEVERLREALEPFSIIAGELFARNYNNKDVVFSIHGVSADGFPVELSLTFEAFNNARQAFARAALGEA